MDSRGVGHVDVRSRGWSEVGAAPSSLFRHSLGATAAVTLLPLVAAGGFVAVVTPNPSALVVVLVGVAVSLGAAATGAAWWIRRPQSVDWGFGELMLWAWWRRRRAEQRLEAGTYLLGLERNGAPRTAPKVSAADQLRVLRDLTEALEAKHLYTRGHAKRVEGHALRTARAMELTGSQLKELRTASSFHDVGRVRVPERLLRKREELTDGERRIVQEHVFVGAWMLPGVGTPSVVEGIFHHHERWDGNGYPSGLESRNIPLYARIIAVADAWVAMTSARPYRPRFSTRRAAAVLRAQAGKQFDPQVVQAFLETLPLRVRFPALLPAPAVVRELGMWTKRVGAASLAPATGAVGVAALVGALILGTSAPRVGPSAPLGPFAQGPAPPAPERGLDLATDPTLLRPSGRAELTVAHAQEESEGVSGARAGGPSQEGAAPPSDGGATELLPPVTEPPAVEPPTAEPPSEKPPSDNSSPTADAGGPYTTSEGKNVRLDGSNSSDPDGDELTYEWDFDGDGRVDSRRRKPTFKRVGGGPEGEGNGPLPVALRVTDGEHVSIDKATVTVHNLAPIVSLPADFSGEVDKPVTVSGTVSDPGWKDQLSATIDWDDEGEFDKVTCIIDCESTSPDISGTLERIRHRAATLGFEGTHTYSRAGTYVITVCGRDEEEGSPVCDEIRVEIVDPAQDEEQAQDGEEPEGKEEENPEDPEGSPSPDE